MQRIGVISDTHGLLRPEALDALRGSEAIIHAGDVGDPRILDRLRELAPVTVVRGNIDIAPWCRRLPEKEVLEAGGASIYILHNIAELDLKPNDAGFAAVIYGHSHKPLIQHKKGVLFFNPGSAGPRRFSLPITVGRLNIENGTVEAQIVPL
jgi:putative phosphoesterase